jgi:hypothetical protein
LEDAKVKAMQAARDAEYWSSLLLELFNPDDGLNHSFRSYPHAGAQVQILLPLQY